MFFSFLFIAVISDVRFFVGQIVDIVLAVFLVIFGKYLGRLVFFFVAVGWDDK